MFPVILSFPVRFQNVSHLQNKCTFKLPSKNVQVRSCQRQEEQSQEAPCSSGRQTNYKDSLKSVIFGIGKGRGVGFKCGLEGMGSVSVSKQRMTVSAGSSRSHGT